MSILNNITAPTVTTDTAVALVPDNDARAKDEARLARIEEVREALEEGDYEKMRAYYSTTYGKETTLDDDDILEIIADSDDDQEPKEWAGRMRVAEMTASNEAMEVSEAVAQDVMTAAHSLGDKLAKSERFTGQMDNLLKANELVKRGDAIVYLMLTSMWSPADWMLVPKPGTKKGETGNQPFDKWTIKDLANEGKSIRFSFFEEVAKTIPAYREILSEYDDVSDVVKQTPELGNARRELMQRTWTRPKQKAHKATLSQRKTKYIGSIKKACQIKVQMDNLSHFLGDGISVQMLTEKQPDGSVEIIRTTTPIEISHKDKPSMCQPFTVGTFLKLKAEEAAANSKGIADSMYGNLLATLDRAPKTPKLGGAGQASKFPTVDSPEDWDSWQASGANFADNRDNLIKLRKWFGEGKVEERDEKVDHFASFYLALQEVWVTVRPLYEDKQKRDAAAAERAAKAGLNTTSPAAKAS